VRRLLPLLALIPLATCGGSPSAPGGGGGGNAATTITITSAGVSTAQLTISPGTRVLFVNNDSRAHNMTSDPHPEHTDCPEINSVGLLQPNQSRETGNLVATRTCGFHDHDDPPPLGARWTGRITIR
jgi:plastocyanin